MNVSVNFDNITTEILDFSNKAPVFNTVTNIFHLCIKPFVHLLSDPSRSTNSYVHYLHKTSYLKLFLLMIPALGNYLAYTDDFAVRKPKQAEPPQNTEQVENLERMITEATKQVENSEKMITEATKQVENSERMITEATKQVESSERMITEATKQVESSEQIIPQNARLVESLQFLLEKIKFENFLTDYQTPALMASLIEHASVFYHIQELISTYNKETAPIFMPDDINTEFQKLTELRKAYVLIACPSILNLRNKEECAKLSNTINFIKIIPSLLLDTSFKKMRLLCETFRRIYINEIDLLKITANLKKSKHIITKKMILYSRDFVNLAVLDEDQPEEIAKGILKLYGIDLKEEYINRLKNKQHLSYLVPFFSEKEKVVCKQVLEAILKPENTWKTEDLSPHGNSTYSHLQVLKTNNPWTKFICHLTDCWNPILHGHTPYLANYILEENSYVITTYEIRSNSYIGGSAYFMLNTGRSNSFFLSCEFSQHINNKIEITEIHDVILSSLTSWAIRNEIVIQHGCVEWFSPKIQDKYFKKDKYPKKKYPFIPEK